MYSILYDRIEDPILDPGMDSRLVDSSSKKRDNTEGCSTVVQRTY